MSCQLRSKNHDRRVSIIMARFNLNNHTMFKGYVNRLFLSDDKKTLYFTLAVKRNYKNTWRNKETGEEEKKYLYDWIPFKVQWRLVERLLGNPEFKEGCYMIVSGAAQTYRMSMKENQLVTFVPNQGFPIVNQTLFVLNEFEIFQEREKPKETVEPELSREGEQRGIDDSLDTPEVESENTRQDSTMLEPINYGQLFSSGYTDRY